MKLAVALLASTALALMPSIAMAQVAADTVGGLQPTPSGFAGSGLYPKSFSGAVGLAYRDGQTWRSLPLDGNPVNGRSNLARAQDVVNVADYGLVCDGATPTDAAFTKAIGKLQPFGTLFVPPQAAKCLLSQPIGTTPLPGNVTIWAYPGSITLAPASGNSGSTLLLGVGGSGYVYGLTFDGGGTSFPNKSQAITIYNGSGYVFDRVTVQNTRGIGAIVSQSSYSGFRNSTFNNVGNYWTESKAAADRQQGIVFCCTASNSSTDESNFAENNTFINIGLDALSATSQTHIAFRGNKCSLANNQQASVNDANYAACIYASSNAGITATANESYGASGNGFDFATSSDLVAIGNIADGSGEAGFGIFGITNGVVSGNRAKNNVQWSNSPYKGGFSFAGLNTNIPLSGNVSTDDQSTKTQQYGAFSYTMTTGPNPTTNLNTNVTFDPASNMLDGNAVGRFGGTPTLSPPYTSNFAPTFSAASPGATPPTFTAFTINYIHTPQALVKFDLNLHETNSGTATGAMQATLPFQAAISATDVSCLDASTSQPVLGRIAGGGNILSVYTFGNSSNIHNSDYYECSGSYVATQ